MKEEQERRQEEEEEEEEGCVEYKTQTSSKKCSFC